MSLIDRVRGKAWAVLDRPGKLGEVARSVNDALGRPLASEEELADRARFAQGYKGAAAPPAPAASAPATGAGEPAPVVVYTLAEGKRRGELPKIQQLLDDAGVPYRVMAMDDDPAAQAAVRRDANMKPPVVFIAGDPVGGREALLNLGRDGLRKRVFGA